MLLTLYDGDHEPLQATLRFKLFIPSATDGTDTQTWLEA